jgi:hypothetical protein
MDDALPPVSIPGGTSQGFENVLNDGTPVLRDHAADLEVIDTRAGLPIRLTRKQVRGDWRIFLESTPASWKWADRILAQQLSTGELREVTRVKTPVGPHLTDLGDGRSTVSVPLPADWSSYFFDSPYLPYTEPVPDRTIAGLSLDRPVWVGKWTPAGGGWGNCSWSPEGSRPFFEGVGGISQGAWVSWLPDEDVCRKWLKGLLFFAKEAQNEGHGEHTFTETVKAALKYGVPVIVGWDSDVYKMPVPDGEPEPVSEAENWEKRFNRAGVRTIPGVRCYPGDWPDGSLQALTKAGCREVALIVALYPQAWDTLAAARAMEDADRVLRIYDSCVIKLGFGDGRPGAMWSEVRRYWDSQQVPSGPGPNLSGRLLVEADAPLSEAPKEDVPAVVEPTPPKVEPPKRRPSGSKVSFWKKLRGLIAFWK